LTSTKFIRRFDDIGLDDVPLVAVSDLALNKIPLVPN